MTAHRVRVKYFLDDESKLDLPALIPVFHRWVQEQISDDLLIDVADYSHVQDGPGVLLVGHAGDVALDMSDNRPGLLYTQKRGWDESAPNPVAVQLRSALQQAILFGNQLAREQDLPAPLNLRRDEVEISFVDRLNWPNTPATYAGLEADVRTVLAEFYPGIDATLQRVHDDPRWPLTVHASLPGAPSINKLAIAQRQAVR